MSRSQHANRFRPVLEALDRRDVPTTMFWTGAVSTDATNPLNWSGGLPSSGDMLYFNGPPAGLPGFPPPPPAPDCVGLVAPSGGGSYGGMFIANSYTATVTLGGAVTVGSLDLEGGAISQPSSGTDLTVTGVFHWTAGTLNSSSHLSTVTITGGTAELIFTPTNGGTVDLGSNITFDDGAQATLEEGTINVTNDEQMIDVKADCAVSVDPGLGLITSLVSLLNTHIRVRDGATWTVNTGTFFGAGELTNSGTVNLKSGTTAFFPGVVADDYAYFQDGGATNLYGSDGTDGLYTAAGKKMLISGGLLDAIFDDGQLGYPSQATIGSDLVITGGDIYINYVSGVSHAVYGQLTVAGDVTWTGGTFHPFVEGDVNAGSSHDYSDFWAISGSLSIGGTAALDATSVVGGSPTGATSGYQWSIITALGGITGTPSYDTNLWIIVPFQNGAATSWRLEAI